VARSFTMARDAYLLKTGFKYSSSGRSQVVTPKRSLSSSSLLAGIIK